MPIRIKTPQEIEKLRISGKLLGQLLRELVAAVKPGVSTGDIDRLAQKRIKELGATPALLGYRPYGAKRPYPAATCISINDEVVHGIPSDDVIFKDGDVVTVDATIAYEGMITDSAFTVALGEVPAETKRLLDITRGALTKGIAAAKAFATTGDIGHAIERHVESQGFHIIPVLAGHGVGYAVHEDPYVPNYGEQGQGEMLVPGMVIAIEPITSIGTEIVVLQKDGYTYTTKDGSHAAHFEHTVLITENGPEILTA